MTEPRKPRGLLSLALGALWLAGLAAIAGATAFACVVMLLPTDRLHALAQQARQSPTPTPAIPLRHPAPDSHPEGYSWVHAHQHSSKWVEGYWRRKPGYVVPLPTPIPSSAP